MTVIGHSRATSKHQAPIPTWPAPAFHPQEVPKHPLESSCPFHDCDRQQMWLRSPQACGIIACDEYHKADNITLPYSHKLLTGVPIANCD